MVASHAQNPGNFNDHRRALMRLSVLMPALVAAYTATKDHKYKATLPSDAFR